MNLETAILLDLLTSQSSADSIAGRIHIPTQEVTAQLDILELDNRLISQTQKTLTLYRLTDQTRQALTNK